MKHLIFIPTNYLLFSPSASDTNISPGLILGVIILTLVLILVLIVLLFKSINGIKDLIKHTNETTEDNPALINVPTDSTAINYIDKLTCINDDLKSFGFAYDSNDGTFYSTMNPWQREFGYCSLYDEAGPALSLIFDSEPIYFDYNGKHWLIEFWKGQYGITTGAEIGIYNTDDDFLNIPGTFQGRFYKAADDIERLNMGFSLVKNDQVVSERCGLHWWLTSFILGEFTHPSELTMYIEITFPHETMADAFIEGLMDAGYSGNDYSVSNNTVYVVFDTPYGRQPYTKTDFVDELMQESNRRNVEIFNNSTDSFTDMVDKLYALKQESGEYYKEVLQLGKPKQLYGIYNVIKKHLD